MILYRVTWPTGSVQSWETFLDHQPDKQWYAKLPSNPWHVAQDKTKQVGKVLARLLLKQMEVAKNRKVVLIGHSLGAAITFQTMLQASDDDSAGVADYVIFLGGAFSPTKDELEILLKKVSCQVFNFYNKEDQVLKIALRAVSLKVEPAAGNIPLAMSQQILGSKLLNFDMTGTIIVDHSTQYGHSYRDVLSLIAEKLQDILI
jgi:predicted esterase